MGFVAKSSGTRRISARRTPGDGRNTRMCVDRTDEDCDRAEDEVQEELSGQLVYSENAGLSG